MSSRFLRVFAVALLFTPTLVRADCSKIAATPLSPPDGAVGVAIPVAFDWTDVPGAAGYRLFVSANGGAANPIAAPPDSQYVGPVPSGSVEWYVETLFPGCPSTFSPHFHFTAVAAVCPPNPQPPQTIAPADGAAGLASPVTFKWSPVPAAVQYHVWLNQTDKQPVLLGATKDTQFVAPLAAGAYSWAVVAVFGENCPTAVSNRAAFTVGSGTQCDNKPPVLNSPPNGATNVKVPVDFQWSPVAGAIAYQLFVSINGSSFDMFAETPEPAALRVVAPGSVAWYVIAKFQGCPDQRSTTSTFSVPSPVQCDSSAPIALQAPANGSTQKSPVTFAWSAVQKATGYRLWIAVDGKPPDIAAKSATPTISLPLPSGAIEWYAEALLNECPSVFSPHGMFTVEKSATCGTSEPATLISPAGTAEQPASTATAVTFKWNAVQGASAYVLWLAFPGQPFGDFAATKETTITRDLPAGKYAWFIDALIDGCPNVHSTTAFFRVDATTAQCSGDAPVLILPTNGDTKVSSPVTFVWSALANADVYRLFVHGVDSPNPEPVMIGATRETSMTVPLPPGGLQWFVEASAPGCPAVRSQISTLSIAKAANCTAEPAQLITPADGSTVSNPPVDFTWNAVSGASRYVLVVRFGDGAPTPLAETADTHLRLPVPEGPIEWWIITFVAGCNAVESQHAGFTVPFSDCVKVPPMLLAPPDGAQILSPVAFEWTPVPNAKLYKVWVITTDGESVVASTTKNEALITLPSESMKWLVEAVVDNCPSPRSPVASLKVMKATTGCTTPAKPAASVIGQVVSGSTYKVRWTVIPNSDHYELQESTSADFTAPSTQIVTGISASFSHDASSKPAQYLYRVRAISSCSDERGPYSDVVSVFVVPPLPTDQQKHVTTEVGSQSGVKQPIAIPATAAGSTFSAKADKSWITITPSSGTVPAGGLTLDVSADPSVLGPGTHTATVQISYGGGKTSVLDSGTTVPVSVSLVSPVAPLSKDSPTPDSMIIPVVAHASGANNSMFESDVRVANTGAQPAKYQVNFTPTGVDGCQHASTSTIQVDAGASMALDDVLASFFGAGSSGTSAAGVLEIRPLASTAATAAYSTVSSSSAQLSMVASSRTYNVTSNGTFGQFIPAIPYSQFISKSSGTAASVLTFQQIAESSKFRTNFGLVEGSGQAATVLLTVYDNSGAKVCEIPQSLQAGQHMQLNQLLASSGITLNGGRIEVTVTSSTGRVTAYASVLDNRTSDPLLVSPVVKDAVSSTRYVVPGVADLNTGLANWRSDVRVYNSGSSAVTATVTYVPQAGSPGASSPASLTIAAGEVKELDSVLQSLFGLSGSGGSLLIATPAASTLVVSARTYNETTDGTYGQFIPGVTAADGVGKGGRALHILQLEHSTRMRTNIGVVETTGNAATVEVALILPDSMVSPKVSIELGANEFRQISLGSFGVSDAYNVRATVKVTSGSGKVAAYGSVIDQQTQDPTYVPAQ